MAAQGSDASPATTALLIDHWRTAPSWQKPAAINELNEALKLLALSDLRRHYPHESAVQLQTALLAKDCSPMQRSVLLSARLIVRRMCSHGTDNRLSTSRRS